MASEGKEPAVLSRVFDAYYTGMASDPLGVGWHHPADTALLLYWYLRARLPPEDAGADSHADGDGDPVADSLAND